MGIARLAVGLRCLLVLLVVNVAETAVELIVEYPQAASNNYSEVELICIDTFGGSPPHPPALFRLKLNGTVIGDVVQQAEATPTSYTSTFTFTFNQQREGTFSCEQYGGGEDSVDLAGM